MKKQVDTTEYLDILSELVKQGETVPVPVAGSSMRPFLRDKRDTAWLSPVTGEIKRGDILLYRRSGGQYVMHRVVRARDGGFDMLGDGQTAVEPGIRREQIAARVTAVKRNGRMLSERSPVWKFFAGPWLAALPVRQALLRLIYRN